MIKLKKFFINILCIFIFCKIKRELFRESIKKYNSIFKYINSYNKIKKYAKKYDKISDERYLFPNYLSIVCIIKNESLYIKEWLDFHILVGVNKFYIYDNNSTDNVKKVLSPYIKSNIVEYIYFPGEAKQISAYEDCISKHKLDTKYLAVIDVDEFLVPKIGETIQNTLERLPDDAAQCLVRWRNFGSSGHDNKQKNILGNYLYREIDNVSGYRWGKAILNPRKVVVMLNHASVVTGKTFDISGFEVKEWKKISVNGLVINHYWCKSKQEFKERWTKGNAMSGSKSRNKVDWKEFGRRDCNNVYDDSVIKYIKNKIEIK